MTQNVAERGMPALALTDHGSMYHHMILLAKDDVGYRNLLALTTADAPRSLDERPEA